MTMTFNKKILNESFDFFSKWHKNFEELKKNFDFNILHNEQNFVNEYDKSFDD